MIKTPKELKKELKRFAKYYISEMEKYQKQCKHKNKSNWISIKDEYLHFNDTGYSIQLCNDCEKTLGVKNNFKPIGEIGIRDSFEDLLLNRWKRLKIDLSKL